MPFIAMSMFSAHKSRETCRATDMIFIVTT